MPLMSIKISDESYAYLRKKVGYRRRGHGAIVDGLLRADQAREETRILMQRQHEQGEASSKRDWDQTGVCID